VNLADFRDPEAGRVVRRRSLLLLVAIVVAAWIDGASAQVIMRPGPGANPGGVVVIEPTFEPPYRLTITVYASGQDGRPLPGLLGANVLVIDPQGRRVGIHESGKAFADVPNAAWGPALNTQPNAPIGPRGLNGSGVTLNDALDGHYVLEIAGTDRALLDLAVAQWDRAGRRRWLHLARASTEPGAVDRWDIPYTAAARPAFDLVERRDDSYLSVRAYGRSGAAGAQDVVAELLLNDARGRRLGREPKTGRDYHEIPRASYDSGTGDSEGREIEVGRPGAGPYTLEVIGTATGRYDVAIYMTDVGGQSATPIELSNVPTRNGVVHRYRLDSASASGTPPLSGAWGQGARLLTYAYPGSARTELAAGETAITLVVFYAPTIAPATFRATLGGRDVSARFKPVPGAWQVIRLPGAAGSNPLVLSVGGAMPDGRTVSHTDALELVRRR
jgi:hypothetical protein